MTTTQAVYLSAPTYPHLSGAVQAGFGVFARVGGYAIQIIIAAIGLGILIIGSMYLWRLIKKWLHTAK